MNNKTLTQGENEMTTTDAIKILKAFREQAEGSRRVFLDDEDIEAIDTVIAELERQELHKEMLSKVSTKEYGEDGIGLSKEDLDQCLYK